jgi:hypothetical protein
MSASPRKVICPICGQVSLYSPDNPWRPFCSERCKLIDLGQWATEQYRLPDGAQAPGEAISGQPEKE